LRNEINLISNFLAKNNIGNYQLDKIAGDASFRHYYRAKLAGNKSYIIMSAPPEFEDIHPFYKIDQILIKNNFSAPKIFAADYENGLMLLEDFGNNSYTKVLAASDDLLKDENHLYKMAVELLLDLNKISAPADLAFYDEKLLMREVMLYIDWYLPYIAKSPASAVQIEQFQNLWLELFKQMSKPSNLVLRDYHADNLMVLTDRTTYQNVGLLDFQDAVIGSPAYDLVSLLEDARRDVDKKTEKNMLQYYLDNFDCDQKTFLYDYAVLSLQRNIKIIGIFSRLAIRDKKPQYLQLLPRVFKHVENRLQDDSFTKIKIFLSTFNS
jgi:hypothetical protein